MKDDSYTVGGSLAPGASDYVNRAADEQLWAFITRSMLVCTVCHILAPRQSGKSSSINNIAYKLMDKEIIYIKISLQEYGSITSSNGLYYNLLRDICQIICNRGLIRSGDDPVNLMEQLNGYWYQQTDIQPPVKFREFIIGKILNRINVKLVIALDEVQSLISFGLNNDFIGFLKSLTEIHDQPALGKLAFVLLGVAKPSDLITNYHYAFTFGTSIELGYFQGSCEPLQTGLARITKEPAKVLEAILFWTGGQPFLTQLVCSLVVNHPTPPEGGDIEEYVKEIVEEKIINNWEQQDQKNHLRGIDRCFYTTSPDLKPIKLAVLRIYSSILASNNCRFNESNNLHWELLISGIVKKEGEYLRVVNPIYAQIFDINWVNEREKFLQEDFMPAPYTTIYDRDIFILVDQSGSMVRKDADTGDQTRYQYVQEIIEGNIASILSEATTEGEKICESISVYFFSRDEVAQYPIKITDPSQVQGMFLENKPKSKTFIGKTINKCLDTWLTEGKPNGRGAFFLVYTDGRFDDEPDFVNCVKRVSESIDDEKAVKFIILGLGKDIDKLKFLELDFNTKKELSHNILVFNLVNEVDDIIQELERQLVDDPGTAFPEWVMREYPDFVKKVKEFH